MVFISYFVSVPLRRGYRGCIISVFICSFVPVSFCIFDYLYWDFWFFVDCFVTLFKLSRTSPVTLRIQEFVVSSCTVQPDSKENELRTSDQEIFPWAGKNTLVRFVAGCAWKCVPTAILSSVNIPKVPGCHLSRKISSQWGSQ